MSKIGICSLFVFSLVSAALPLLVVARNTPARMVQGKDIHSFARPAEVVVTHLNLDIDVDFDTRRISGRAALDLDNIAGADQLYLDTRDLTINRITLDQDEKETTFQLGQTVEHLGRPLVIKIEPGTRRVNIDYSTDPGAAALQWLEPQQTSGGKHPFLFTQSQSILARTWIPIQDSPGIRFTYEARVRTNPVLLAVMSAENPVEKEENGVYTFKMSQPIPAYLMALAVGDLVFQEIGPRTGVYAEPSVISRAAWEFADMEKMITAAEALNGPYRWKRYDVIVLPPSFPFGGMENPRLTFVTPTILAGDRSLVSLIAHELAHSWSGNLVTNATWGDFWLNEGFTTYFERRIMEAIAGQSYAQMLAVLGKQDLDRDIHELGPDSPETRLYVDLQGRDPDDGATNIPYEKGYFLLRLIEENVGREKWDAFLRTYFDSFAFQSMTTSRFLDYLREDLLAEYPGLEEKLNLQQWIYGKGVPENIPVVESDEFDRVDVAVSAWNDGRIPEDLDTTHWTTHHWLHFLRGLEKPVDLERMARLEDTFKFSQSGNSEILFAWLEHVVASEYQPAYPLLETFLTGMGRRKFLVPLYAKLANTSSGMRLARQIYQKARPSYHPVSYSTIDEILHWIGG